MILSMGAGQLDLVSHSLIIKLLPLSFNDGIKFDDIKVSGSLFVCSNMILFWT